jgi:hypothetical protein
MRSQVSEEPPSLYALVIYLPDPLGTFLDHLRLELVPGCNPHAHVSLLPPRPLPVAPDAAIEEARAILDRFPPFDIELGHIEKFDKTDVIYISIEGGTEQLRQMHGSLNRGSLASDEPFVYHPHVTLAQEIDPTHVEPLLQKASLRWSGFPGPRRFRAVNAVFVRNVRGNSWIDLAGGTLRGTPVS